MDIKFEKVKERVGYEVDCAIDLFFDAKEELEWPSSLIAGWERNVL